MEIVGFDSYLFSRSWTEKQIDQNNPTKADEVLKRFTAPLGCGVKISKSDSFLKDFRQAFLDLSRDFAVPLPFYFVPSRFLEELLGRRRAIPFVDKLIERVQDNIDYVHVCYVSWPIRTSPTITVGGFRSPAKELSARDYLIELQNAMPFLTAYSYKGSPTGKNDESKLMIDSFNFKNCRAWDRLIENKNSIELFMHGDECNPFICAADLMCFLINFRLYTQKDYEHRRLSNPNVVNALFDFSFKVEPHFFMEDQHEAFVYYDYKQIDCSSKWKHPIVFLMYDKTQGQTVRLKELVLSKILSPATALAFSLGGCVKLFEDEQDSGLVDDGDHLVCVGDESIKQAQKINMGVDVTIWTGTDLRKKFKT